MPDIEWPSFSESTEAFAVTGFAGFVPESDNELERRSM